MDPAIAASTGRKRSSPRAAAVAALMLVLGGTGIGGAGVGAGSEAGASAPAARLPSADARLEQAQPRTNYGRSSILRVDGTVGARAATLIRFDLRRLRNVDRAILRLYVLRSARDPRVRVYAAGNAWNERRVTWTTAPRALGTAVAVFRPAAHAWTAVDVTRLARRGGIATLRLETAGRGSAVFASRESRRYRPTLTVAPARSRGWSPARWRFAYSNRVDQGSMRGYGYNLIDVSTVDEANAVPSGTRAQVWLYDYDNKTCGWEKDDAYVRSIVSPLAHDPKVAGFYFSNEPDPFACPNAPKQHRERNALIKSLAPDKYTIIGIDANWREHFDRYGKMWVGTADYLNYNPYICYKRDPSNCDFQWLDHVLAVAQSLPQPYFVALQAFREDDEWRWPTAAEEARMLDRLKKRALTRLRGYMTFAWNWQDDPLRNHPAVLAEIQAYNLGKPSPCCSGTGTTTTTTTTTPTTSTGGRTTPAGRDPSIVAAGDLCGSATSCAATATLVQSLRPTAVLTLGDNAYEDGSPSQYAQYYAPNWGRFLSITYPTTGNHDYHTSGAAGFFGYFGARAPAPFYSFNLGAWHLIALGSTAGVPAGAGSAEDRWLRADLAAHRNRCVLAYWHEPRWSSGSVHGNDSSSAALWADLYAAHADVILNGHDHNYQRFGTLNPSGAPDPHGMREFVVGTGGWGHYGFTSSTPAPEARNLTDYGVLELVLHPGSYTWRFVSAGGSFTDSGTAPCK